MYSDREESKFSIEDDILKGKTHDLPNYKSFGHFLMEHLGRNPNFPGQIEFPTDRQYTFGQMKNMSIRLALWLLQQNVQQNDIIGLCTHNHMDTFLPFFGTLFSGAIFNPWFHDITLELAEYFMGFVKPKIIFANAKCIEVLEKAAKKTNVRVKIVTFEKISNYDCIYDLIDSVTDERVSQFQPVEVRSPLQTGLIVFSSGTTGLSKAVELSHAGLLTNISTLAKTALMPEKGSMMLYSPMYWLSAPVLRLSAVLMNSTLIIHKEYNPEETSQIVEKYKLDWLFLVSPIFHHFYQSKAYNKYDFSSLKVLYTGGSNTDAEVLTEMRKHLSQTTVFESYGQSETSGVATAAITEPISSVGLIAPGNQMKVIDLRTGTKLKANQPGEILLKSPIIMNGYYLNEKATKETIDDEGWVHTGDMGYFDENGCIFFIDRIKEIMVVKGHHVGPTEIEQHLRKKVPIADCAVVGVAHLTDGYHPVAFVEKRDYVNVTEEEILKVAEELGDIKRLRAGVRFLDKLPRTPSGKIDRKRVREMANELSEIPK